MAADVVADFMKHFKNLEKQLGSFHWQQCVDRELAREHEQKLKRLSRSSDHKKSKAIGSFARSHLKKMTEELGRLLLPPEKEGLLCGLRVTRKITLLNWISITGICVFTRVVLLILGSVY